eukprot:233925-Prymnesium_polylepis.1
MAHAYGHHRSPPASASRVRTGAVEAVGSRGSGGRTITLVPGCHGYPGTCRKVTNRTEPRVLCETRVRNRNAEKNTPLRLIPKVRVV